MVLFLFGFFSIYGAVHAYVFYRLRSAFVLGPGATVGVVAFLLAMTAAPVLSHVLEGRGEESAARDLAWVGYLWMGVLFFFFSASLLVSLANLAFRLPAWVSHGGTPALLVSARASFVASLPVSLCITVYGYFEARDVRTERLTLETAKLPPGVDRLRIVQISDVHLGLIVRSERLERILDAARAAKPDIFVSTGDLVDAEIDHLPRLAEMLRSVEAPRGKFAVTGNHEFYAGIDEALEFTRKAGFTVFRGESASNGAIQIAGVDDPTVERMGPSAHVSEKRLLSSLPGDRFTLLLKHRPVVENDTAGLFDLQLSGHTHKGQIFPFTLLSKLAYPMNAGRFSLPGGATLRVSRGSGTWGPPLRFLAPPEVTVIDLVRKGG